MHVSAMGVRDLSGAIVTQTPSRLLSDALASDPIRCGRRLRAAQADKPGLEVTPAASGLPGESCSSAKPQVSLQQVFLVLGSRVASCRLKLVLRFLGIAGRVNWFSLTQLLFNLNCKRKIMIDNLNFFLFFKDMQST